MSCVVIGCHSATCYNIGGYTSLDGVGTIIKIGKIKIIPCIFAPSVYIVYIERIDAYKERKVVLMIESILITINSVKNANYQSYKFFPASA